MSTYTLTPDQDTIFESIGAFCENVLPDGFVTIRGQQNRTATPTADNYAVFWTLRRPRLATNITTYMDGAFEATIAGEIMDVASIDIGQVTLNTTLFGPGIANGTVVVSQTSGPTGGAGQYLVNIDQTIALSTLATGQKEVMQETEIVAQLDIHGPRSDDNVQIISTLFRDFYGVDFFDSQFPGISPLYTDDPMQVPFDDDQTQVETRWIITLHLQANQGALIPQQFAEIVGPVELINVEATYGP